MNLSQDEERALRDAVRGLLDKHTGADAWKRLTSEIGVAALGVPERYGGAEAGLAAVCVVQEELGRALAATPMLGSAVLTATVLLATGDQEARERLLPGVAAGERTAALAWAGTDGRWDPSNPACLVDDEGRLHGTAHYVLDGDTADVLLVAARDVGGVGLFEVDPAHPHRVAATTMDQTRPLATVMLDGVPGRRLAGGDHSAALAYARDVACVALAAEQVGAAARCLRLTVDYTRKRVQFGRPIASFQALRHRMADLHVLVETARSAIWAATSATPVVPPVVREGRVRAPGSPDNAVRAESSAKNSAAGISEFALLAAVAKVHCSEAFQRVAGEMIQLHGGIAITWEHDAHRYFKRAHGGAQLFGQPREHVARLAAVMLASEDPAPDERTET
jgi:alkylation response protein AidB-like acyl-CoA dehydrogenase